MLGDELAEHLNAFWRLKVDDLHAGLRQPFLAALKVDRFAQHHLGYSELAHKTAAVPARGERRDHHRLPVAALASRVPKRIGLAMDGRIVLLDAAVAAAAEQLAVRA